MIQSMTNLAQRWCDAPVLELEEPEQEELYSDSINEADTFSTESIEQNALINDKVMQVCINVIKKFEKLSVGELEQLAFWVGRHSNGVSKGAFKAFHAFLFSVIEKIKKCPSILNFLPNNVSDSHSDCLKYLDLAAFHYINKNDVTGFFSLPDEIQQIIFSILELKDLLMFYKIVKQPGKLLTSTLTKKFEVATLSQLLLIHAFPRDNLCKGIVLDELIKRLNHEKIFLKDLKINDSQIVSFFGKKCADILLLDFSDFRLTGLGFLKHFPNLQKIKLPSTGLFYNFTSSMFSSGSEMTGDDLENMRFCPNLESVEIRECNNLKNLNFLNDCKKIRNLKIYFCSNLDDKSFDTLQDNKYLQSLSMNNINITNLNFLKKFPNLKTVSLKNLNIKNIKGFKYCKNLWNIKLSALFKIEDIGPIGYCEHLQTLIINGCKNISDFDVLKKNKNLKNLTLKYLSQLDSSTDFSFINSLNQLEITACQKLTNTNFLEYCQENLRVLKLMTCNGLKEFNFTGNMINLKSLTLNGIARFESLRFSYPLPQLEKADLSCSEIDDDQLNLILQLSPNIKNFSIYLCTLISQDLKKSIRDRGIELLEGKYLISYF